MDAHVLLRRARELAQLSLRQLAARAGTSHSTLAAYESGSKIPRADTLARIVRSAGYEIDVRLVPIHIDADDRGRELVDVLDLADQFPARPPRRIAARFSKVA